MNRRFGLAKPSARSTVTAKRRDPRSKRDAGGGWGDILHGPTGPHEWMRHSVQRYWSAKRASNLSYSETIASVRCCNTPISLGRTAKRQEFPDNRSATGFRHPLRKWGGRQDLASPPMSGNAGGQDPLRATARIPAPPRGLAENRATFCSTAEPFGSNAERQLGDLPRRCPVRRDRWPSRTVRLARHRD